MKLFNIIFSFLLFLQSNAASATYFYYKAVFDKRTTAAGCNSGPCMKSYGPIEWSGQIYFKVIVDEFTEAWQIAVDKNRTFSKIKLGNETFYQVGELHNNGGWIFDNVYTISQLPNWNYYPVFIVDYASSSGSMINAVDDGLFGYMDNGDNITWGTVNYNIILELNAVPDVSVWLSMIIGFSLIGSMARMKRGMPV